jgi:hypothetical protein
MSTNDKEGKQEPDKKGADQGKGVDLTNIDFTQDGTMQGLPDEDLDTLTGGLMTTNYMCPCGDPNSAQCG